MVPASVSCSDVRESSYAKCCTESDLKHISGMVWYGMVWYGMVLYGMEMLEEKTVLTQVMYWEQILA